MGFFDKGVLGQMKDVLTKGPSGVFNDEAREQLPLATSMNNPDGTVNLEAMQKMQQQLQGALDKRGKSFLSRMAPDVLEGFQKVTSDAIQRQNAMVEMFNEHQRAKAATAGGGGPVADAGPVAAGAPAQATAGRDLQAEAAAVFEQRKK